MITSFLSSYLGTYGYLAVFAAVGLESAGAPVPGETTLIAAEVLAGTTHRLAPGWLVVVAAAAAIMGDNLGYVVGARGGTALLRRYGQRIGVDQRKLDVAQYIFRRHGGKIVFLGRFVSILRTYAAVLAGVNGMRWRWFAACNAAGGVLWAALFGIGSYELGHTISRLGTILSLGIGGLVAVLLLASFLFGRRYIARLFANAAAQVDAENG